MLISRATSSCVTKRNLPPSQSLDFPTLVADGGEVLRSDLGVTSKLHHEQLVRALKRVMLGIGTPPFPPLVPPSRFYGIPKSANSLPFPYACAVGGEGGGFTESLPCPSKPDIIVLNVRHL